jgi:hypothetical protein
MFAPAASADPADAAADAADAADAARTGRQRLGAPAAPGEPPGSSGAGTRPSSSGGDGSGGDAELVRVLLELLPLMQQQPTSMPVMAVSEMQVGGRDDGGAIVRRAAVPARCLGCPTGQLPDWAAALLRSHSNPAEKGP